MSLRTPLNRVLGLGSAKEGTSHFWAQRLSGMGIALLGPWFIWSIATMSGYSHAQALAFIAEPLHGVLLLLLLTTMSYHSYLGLQVIIEDYVHSHGLKLAALVISRFVHVLFAVAAIYAILKIGLGA